MGRKVEVDPCPGSRVRVEEVVLSEVEEGYCDCLSGCLSSRSSVETYALPPGQTAGPPQKLLFRQTQNTKKISVHLAHTGSLVPTVVLFSH